MRERRMADEERLINKPITRRRHTSWREPLVQDVIPYPCLFPFTYSPWYLSPLALTYVPLPATNPSRLSHYSKSNPLHFTKRAEPSRVSTNFCGSGSIINNTLKFLCMYTVLDTTPPFPFVFRSVCPCIHAWYRSFASGEEISQNRAHIGRLLYKHLLHSRRDNDFVQQMCSLYLCLSSLLSSRPRVCKHTGPWSSQRKKPDPCGLLLAICPT